MLDQVGLRFAIEDARIKHGAVVALIETTTRQSMALLSLYVTLGLAAASGAATGFGGSSIVPLGAAWALLVGAFTVLAGAGFCFHAMYTSMINLPGRGPEFWLWADDSEISFEDACREYLRSMEEKRDSNNALNARAAWALHRAKLIGILAPILTLLSGVFALF